MLMRFVERLGLRNVCWCAKTGAVCSASRCRMTCRPLHALLVMNTGLGIGQVTEGFRQWRAYSNAQSDLPVGKLFARGKADMTPAETAAYDARFPDATYKVALKSVPEPGARRRRCAGCRDQPARPRVLAQRMERRQLMAIGMKDPVLGEVPMRALQRDIRNCPLPLEVAEGGHFVQEWGAPIARAALQRFAW